MPFGARLLQGGGASFRLWAPAARRVDLLLEHSERPMGRDPDGWFETLDVAAGPGARYSFRIDGELAVPDPASRCQARDVHGPSVLTDPLAYHWEEQWTGRPWHEAAIYELHVGSFSPSGTFAGVRERLDHLAGLGVSALELMPVADFPGSRDWGYNGALLYAPDRSYGSPEDLKDLVQAAHRRGLMVFLDVVYNHFGPEGNYLHLYAPAFFHRERHTPWGAALNLDGPHSDTVRAFFVHNALYWLEEFRLDGLRLDAVHAIEARARDRLLGEIAAAVQAGPARERHVHLVLENDANDARYLADGSGAGGYAAQWNDDLHHCAHVLATGETDGYYADYREAPLQRLGQALAEGFVYQGEPSEYRDGAPRGEPSAHLPATAFVDFIQNHDQAGNRAFGERLGALIEPAALEAFTAMLLLAPSPPLLFMGQEWAAAQPFLFFCDLGEDLAEAVTEGRRSEFTRGPAFAEPRARARIPDPMDAASFQASRLRWSEPLRDPHRRWLALHRELLWLRAEHIVPRLPGMAGGGHARCPEGGPLRVSWTLGDGTRLILLANLSPQAANAQREPAGWRLYATSAAQAMAPASASLPPWTVLWHLEHPARESCPP